MYSEHPICQRPMNEEIKIWRYMDFTKFVSMLEHKSLYFTRSDKFEDPFEGTYSRANQDLRSIVYKDALITEEGFRQFDKIAKKFRLHTLINCWHMNEYESAAMWKLYLKSNEGIAIQSTFKRLCDSFNDTDSEIFIGKVNYVDYESEWIPEGYSLSPFLFKRKSFEHEREIRVVMQDLPLKEDKVNLTLPKYEFGTNIPVDLEILIENVYVAPTSPSWFNELVFSILNKYEIDKGVFQSTLYHSPF